MFGTVTHFNAVKRFGFIRVSEHDAAIQPADTFFHASEFQGDEAQLIKGALVEFRIGEFKGRAVARDVRLLQAADDDSSSPGSASAIQRSVRAVLGGGAA